MKLKEGMIIECRNGHRYLLRKICGELIASSSVLQWTAILPFLKHSQLNSISIPPFLLTNQ